MERGVFGVGTNDADYAVKPTVNGKRSCCPFYRVWQDMLRRCYDEDYKTKFPTYVGCSVCEEWLTFSKFKKWMEQQDYKGKQLDKDILVRSNKIYGPDTCVFITSSLNVLLTDRAAARGDYPIGVCWDRGESKFSSQVCINGKNKRLGRFTTSAEAHKAWQTFKRDIIEEVLTKQNDKRVKEALLRRCNQLQFDIDHGLETTKL